MSSVTLQNKWIPLFPFENSTTTLSGSSGRARIHEENQFSSSLSSDRCLLCTSIKESDAEGTQRRKRSENLAAAETMIQNASSKKR